MSLRAEIFYTYWGGVEVAVRWEVVEEVFMLAQKRSGKVRGSWEILIV